MNYTKVENLRYASPNGSSINMDVYFTELGETVPFTATPNDVMEYGRELYQRAVAGDFGPISPYEGPSEEELAAQQVRAIRDQKLVELDMVATNPLRWESLTQEQKDSLAVYRQDLLDVPQQSGFPYEVNWPDKPTFLQ